MALFGVLILAGLTPRNGQAQGPPQTPPPKRETGGLVRNYPNPFNPETWIEFTVGDYPACSEPGRRFEVTLNIYNLLRQLVAIPVLQSSGGVAGGQQINKLRLACGKYTGYWTGKYLNTRQEVASGLYQYILTVDGRQVAAKKMTVSK